MTPERYQKILGVLAKRQPDLTVIVDRLHIGRNLAAIRRTCDAMGVGELHAVVPDGFKQKRFAGTTSGTHKWVALTRHRSSIEAVNAVKAKGMRVLAADVGPGALDYREIDLTKPTAIIMGAELGGIHDETATLVDGFFSVPMIGMVESFNVSVACALILSEAIHQRAIAGMLKQPRLPDDEIERLAFEWAYPKLKRYYQWKGLDYPPLDDKGELL